MGDPKFSRRKFDRPSHPWQAERIASEREIVRKFGLKNKTELWKAQNFLRRIRGQARALQARRRTGNPQAEKETQWLLARLYRYGLLEAGANLDDVLAIDLERVLNRRLQTVVYQKGLAHTPKQARQFIVHGHLRVEGRRVTIPGMLVTRSQEATIDFDIRSPLAAPDHPMRPERTVVGDGVASPVADKVSLDAPMVAESPKPQMPAEGGE